MIGIHIYPKILSDYQDKHTLITKEIKEYKFTISYHKESEKQVFFENKDYFIFIDGWIFNSPTYEEQAEYVLNLFLSNKKEDFPYLLEGQFNICIVNKTNCNFLFITDIFSLRKHYYSNQNNNQLFLSSDLEFFNLYVDLELNEKHLIKHLRMSRFIKVSETFFKNVQAVSPCLMIERNDTILINIYKLQKVALNYKTTSFIEKDVTKFFIDNVKYVHKNKKVLLELSGGLDSRFVLEILTNSKIDVKTMTYGIEDSDELNIAKIVAKKNKVQHYEINLIDSDFIRKANIYIKQVGGMDLFVQSNVYSVFSNLEKKVSKDYIIDTGLYLDFLIGDIYTNEKDFKEDNNIKGENSFLKTKKGDIKFVLENRFYSSLAIRLAAHREYFDDRYSMLSYQSFFYLLSLPLDKRLNYSLYQKLSKKIIKNSFNVALHNTMYGLDLNISLWDKAKQIQYQKEMLALEHFRLTKKAIYHNRYYSDFDMWLRDKLEWKNKINELLLSDNTLIYKFIDKSHIEKIIDIHMKAENSLHTKLIKWMSIEIFLREFTKWRNKK